MLRFVPILVLIAACGSKSPAEPLVSTTCAADTDCIVSCDDKGDCCDSPWCERVQHKDVAAANAAFNRRECPGKQQDCPVHGDRADPSYTIVPRCTAGACGGERVPKAGPAVTPATRASGSEVVDTSGYAKTCKTTADCKIVKDDPCNRCSCAEQAIAATDLARFQQASAAIECSPRPEIRCSECRGSVAECFEGKCVAKPAP